MQTLEQINLTLSNGKNWSLCKAVLATDCNQFQLAQEQAKTKSLYTMPYSQSGELRDSTTKYQRQLMGSIAEIFAEEFFNSFLSANGLIQKFSIVRYDNVRTDGFRNPGNEYDLMLHDLGSGKKYTIECRSSIAHNRSLVQAIEQFDIIGPYSSSAKKTEEYSHIYIRPLYVLVTDKQKDYDPNEFENLVSDRHIDLYITGGCFKKQMIQNGYQKSMHQHKSEYRVLKITSGLDASVFQNQLKLILSAKKQ